MPTTPQAVFRNLPQCTIFLLVTLSLATLPALVDAEDLPDRPPTEELLPETTIAFAKITSASEMFEKIRGGANGNIIDDEAFGPLMKQLYETVEDQYAKAEDSVGLSLNEIRSLPSGEMSIALVAPRRQDTVAVVLMELDDENEAVDKALGRARDIISNEAEIEETPNDFNLKIEKAVVTGQIVYFCRHQGVMIGCSSLDVLKGMLVRWSGGEVPKVRPLSENRKYITIINRCSASEERQPDLRCYVDPIGVFKANAKGDVGMQVGIAMLPVLGLDGVLAVGGNAYLDFDGHESIAHGHVLLASPREGIIDALALKPGDYQPQDWVPVNVASYLTTSWDPQQMFAKIAEMVDIVQEGGFQGWVDGVNERANIDAKADVVDAVTGRFTIVRPILSTPAINGAGNVIAAQLKDPEAFTEFLETLFAREAEQKGEEIWKLMEHEGVGYWTLGDRVKNQRLARRKRSTERRNKRRAENGQTLIEDADPDGFSATMRAPRPSLTVLGDSLIISDSEEFIKTAIETSQGSQDTLFDHQEFQSTTKTMTRILKTELPAAMLYADSARELASLASVMDSDDVQKWLNERAEEAPEYFSGIKAAFDDNSMPSQDDISKFVPPSGGFITGDDSGYHILIFQQSAAARN